jgi:ferritin-like metal-binding protein YciE
MMKASSWFTKMLGTEMTLNNLENVLILQLRDLHNAEERLIAALPAMADAAVNPALKKAFQEHLEETKQHKIRLEDAFQLIGQSVESETCEAMEGLIEESQEIINLDGDSDVKDAALIAAAQRIEHYEIAGYGCARTFAQQLGHDTVAHLLQKTLNEEGRADKTLTKIAESGINVIAAHS